MKGFGSGIAGLVLCCVALASSGATAANNTVALSQGTLQGSISGNVASFLDIPYAAPPVGKLRWAPPAPAPHWQGIRAASSFGPACMQPPVPGRPPMQTSEDCLTLNIWKPADSGPGARLPVMVWIHGGAFAYGSGSNPAYNGAAFARGGVVLVTLNYRLGHFGFFAHPALTAENPHGPLANYGLMDQIAALKWVKANIAAFGGDPGNVTVFGESAGGISVNYLMTSPRTRGLFAKAISESGFGRIAPAELKDAEVAGVQIARDAGIVGADAAALAALRAAPAEALVGEPKGLSDPLFLRPVRDGVIITEPVAAAFSEGHQARAPYLEGGNSYEASLFPIVRRFPDETLSRLHADSPGVMALFGDVSDHEKVALDIVTDQQVIEPDRYLARQMVRAHVPVWVYFFSYLPAAQRATEPGARHGAEIPYVFDTLPSLPIQYGSRLIPAATPEDSAIARAMHAYWIAFARSGDPGKAGGAPWPRFDDASQSVIEFGADGVVVRPAFRAARLDAVVNLANPLDGN